MSAFVLEFHACGAEIKEEKKNMFCLWSRWYSCNLYLLSWMCVRSKVNPAWRNRLVRWIFCNEYGFCD